MSSEEKQQKADLDNHANQLNPNNERFQPVHKPEGWRGNQAATDLRAMQMNPNNPLYHPPKGKK